MRTLITLTSCIVILLGVAMLVVTVSHGGGVGLLLGPLFMAAGAGRLWMLRRTA